MPEKQQTKMDNVIQIGKIKGIESKVTVDNNLVTLCSSAEKTNKCSFRNDGMLMHMHHEADIGFIDDYAIMDPVLTVDITKDSKITYKFSAHAFDMLPMRQDELLRSIKSTANTAEIFYDKLKANNHYQLNNLLQVIAETVLEKVLNFDFDVYDKFEIEHIR